MSTGPRVCVVLSGCGVFDGSEIHESVATLLALSAAGAQVGFAAPDKDQAHVVNHQTGEVAEGERRNVRVEAARIARGPVADLAEVDVADFDALFLPGGFGAAKNLSSLAFEGPKGTADPALVKIAQDFHAAGKPIGAVCIAPAVLVMALGKGHVTIGADPGTAGAIEAMGGTHSTCAGTEICVDTENRFVTAPAYMLDAPVHEVAAGISAAVGAVLELCS